MHIYIPPFWAGVLVTILTQVAIIIVCAVWAVVGGEEEERG